MIAIKKNKQKKKKHLHNLSSFCPRFTKDSREWEDKTFALLCTGDDVT